jgi:hypothetical protein
MKVLLWQKNLRHISAIASDLVRQGMFIRRKGDPLSAQYLMKCGLTRESIRQKCIQSVALKEYIAGVTTPFVASLSNGMKPEQMVSIPSVWPIIGVVAAKTGGCSQDKRL